LTRGRAATPDPFDLSAVSDTDALFDALAARRFAEAGDLPGDDPAAALLTALVADVDAGAPPLAAPCPAGHGIPATCRRGVRVFVSFGVAALVLTSAGAAAAGGGNGVDALGNTHGSARTRVPERSNENTRQRDPAVGTVVSVRRPAARHSEDEHRGAQDDAAHDPAAPQDCPRGGHRADRGVARPKLEPYHPSRRSDGRNPAGHRRPTPTATPDPRPSAP
jgi:hypothetical protein